MAVWQSSTPGGNGSEQGPEYAEIGGAPFTASTVNGRYVTPQQQAARQKIIQAYKSFLGREPSEEEIDSQLSGGRYTADKNVFHAESNIRGSQEAQDYAKKQAADAAAGSGGTPGGAAAPAVGGVVGAPPSSAYGNFAGFNFDQDAANRDPKKSAKYAFSQYVGEGAVPESKEAAEAYFLANIAPKMEADGHKINWVKGDKVNFTNHQGTFTIDYVQGAGAPGAKWAWQVDDGGEGAAAAAAAPQSAVAAQQALSSGGAPGGGAYNIDTILAALQAQLMGQGGNWFTKVPNG